MTTSKPGSGSPGSLEPEGLAGATEEAARPQPEMTLRAIRELTGRTQVQAAAGAGMTQSDVSFLERREDHRVSTLARYITGLGGELVLLARFGDRNIRIGPIRTRRKTVRRAHPSKEP